MRIFIVTQDSPIYISDFLQNFIRFIDSKVKIVSIYALSPYFEKNVIADISSRLSYYGFTAFFKYLILMVNNKLKSYFKNLFWIGGRCYSISNICKYHNVQMPRIIDINSQSFINDINNYKIDLVISIASPQVFGKKLLSTRGVKFINLHSSLLPKYKGRQPLFWAMLNSEPKTGVTVHYMSEKIDRGKIIMQKSFSINESDSLHDLYIKVLTIGPKALFIAINLIRYLSFEGSPQTRNKIPIFRLPRVSDRINFYNLNKRFL